MSTTVAASPIGQKADKNEIISQLTMSIHSIKYLEYLIIEDHQEEKLHF
jgi:hypothetical protein